MILSNKYPLGRRVSIFISAFLVVVLILSFYSCTSSKKSHIKIGYIPIAECAQIYVAKEMGYFEKEGLEVDLISLSGGAPILDGLMSGSLDVGFSNVVSLIIRRAQDAKFFSVFGGTYETKEFQNHAILVSSSRWKSNPKDVLKGAKIAINTFKNVEEMMVGKYLNSIGLDWSQSSKVEAAFPRMLPLLEAGTIDAASIVEPFITIAKDDSTGKFKWLCNHYLTTTPKTLVATYVSSEKVALDKHEELIKFQRAMQNATNYIHSNEGQTRQIIGKYVKIAPELLTKIGLSEFNIDSDPNAIDAIIKDMGSMGYLSNLRVPDKEELIWKP